MMGRPTTSPVLVEDDPFARPGRRRTVSAIAVGNALEWYDFSVYATLSSVLGRLFFPAVNPLVSLLASFSVFAVGFAARPVGAAVFGRLADRRGRKLTMVVVVVLMGVATVLVGLLPTYASIGVAAPLLLVVARIAQGLSVGGEFSASTSYLVEIAPSRRRGLYGSFAYSTANLGFAFGLALVLVLNLVLPAGAITEWAWRIPFLLSLPLLLIGAYLRSRTRETPAFTELLEAGSVTRHPLRGAFTQQWRPMLRLVGVGVAFSISSYTVLAFALSYLTVVQRQPTTATYTAVLVAALLGAAGGLGWGALSDRIGRRPLLLAGGVATVVVALPAYLLLQSGGFVSMLLGLVLLWVPTSMFAGVVPSAYSEMFPTKLRTTGVGLGYAATTAIFSGTTPVVSTLLIDRTGNATSPAWYLMAGGLISVIVIAATVRETATDSLRTV